MSSDEESMMCTPSQVREAANLAALDLIPQKSNTVYERTYCRFERYLEENNISIISENVLIAYMAELSASNKSSTLWSTYSIINSMLRIKKNIDISKFMKLRAFLKQKNVGYLPKKSRTLTRVEFQKFLAEAPDDKYLMHKVVYILGIAGACRREELAFLKNTQIEDLGSALLIKIPDNKTNRPRSFIVTGENLKYFRKYTSLRPKNYEESCRFFVGYKNGRCYKQNVGIHKIGAIPFEIACFLKLPNAKEYTGQYFRRTSATLLADAGADITLLKRHGGWKSSTVAESYVDESLHNKLDITNKILHSQPHTPAAPHTLQIYNQPYTSTSPHTIPSHSLQLQHSGEKGNKNTIFEADLTTVAQPEAIDTNTIHKTTAPQAVSNANIALDFKSVNRPIIIQNCSNFTININKATETM